MSLIPWIDTKDNRTVVTEQSDFRRDGKAVLVLNYNAAQFTEPGSTNASYDLRVGRNYLIYGNTKPRPLDVGKTIKLRSGKSAIIETEEQVFFPESLFGLIVPKESLQREGISNTPTKVDPGYPGENAPGFLHITVFNHSTKTISLKRHAQFCALCLFQVLGEVAPYSKGGKELDGRQTKLTVWLKIWEWLAKNWLLVILAISAIGGLVLNIVN